MVVNTRRNSSRLGRSIDMEPTQISPSYLLVNLAVRPTRG